MIKMKVKVWKKKSSYDAGSCMNAVSVVSLSASRKESAFKKIVSLTSKKNFAESLAANSFYY